MDLNLKAKSPSMSDPVKIKKRGQARVKRGLTRLDLKGNRERGFGSVSKVSFELFVGQKDDRTDPSVFNNVPASADHMVLFQVRVAAAGVRSVFVDGAFVGFKKRARPLSKGQVPFEVFLEIFGLELIKIQAKPLRQSFDIRWFGNNTQTLAAIGALSAIHTGCDFAADSIDSFCDDFRWLSFEPLAKAEIFLPLGIAGLLNLLRFDLQIHLNLLWVKSFSG
jgi:hypothetical protein